MVAVFIIVTALLSLVNSFLIFTHINIINSVFNWWRLHYNKVTSDEAVTQLTKFVHLYSCNNNITLKMAVIVAETC